ncbi:MAG: hypothetical protein IT308_06485 [Anaerolineaceae bacterium]|nr:hypothetical protein [Anaerolineaceae bacterium]
MFKNIVRVLGGDPIRKEMEKMSQVVEEINLLEEEFEALSGEALLAKTGEFKQRLEEGGQLDDLLPEAFAAVREASKRTLGMRHYDIQLIGGATLHAGKIAEMRTGEGKTLVATLPVYLNALTGKGVHLITVNDYLARRDARWMAPIFHALGLSVGVLQMAGRTENGRMAFLVDPQVTSPHEDQHQLRLVLRRDAYLADVIYGTNSEFGFDYLRDNLTLRLDDRVQRGHHYAIIDEVDNVLIDEARTPLIISGPAQEETEWYLRMVQVARALNPDDYEVNEKDRTVSLTEIGEAHVEELLDTSLRDPERPEDITPEQARLLGYLEQALRAQFLYRRNKDYLVQSGKVVIVDEFTGRLMPGRRWSEGLHQAIEAKEGVKIEPANVTYATITLQNYFRMYEKLAGMTGTALTEAEEFDKIYKLEVFPIPTNLEYQAQRPETGLVNIEAKDEQGYKYTYYTQRSDLEKKPVFWRRKDYPDVVYRSEEAKLRAITREIIRFHVIGRPQLIGTTSVEHSDRLSERLSAEPLRRLLQIELVRQGWMEKNNLEILDRPVPELQPFHKDLNEINPGDLRPLARTLGISLNMEEPDNLERLETALQLTPLDRPRLLRVIQGGISHRVLNARKHDEESQIIARAGAFGAVTIATNMAGRGVDIKLGGELTEEILRDVNRVLNRAGADPFNMTHEERRVALQEIPAEEYGIYEESVNAFLESLDGMKRVRQLGGLHVIGSERHEARRIDNQLRGRSARQGDPGSSRFYLSLEDDLMRLFGGQQVENLWKRIFFDDSLPLEMHILGRLVEQSQERVEGSNFDVRKHLLEYDDVLNAQRKRIYEQRDRVFTKEDLSDDVLEMLRADLQNRIPEALKDKEGPWKLLAYLDDIQPSFQFEEISQPSFSYRLLIDAVRAKLPEGAPQPEALRSALLEIAGQAITAERDHLLGGINTLLDNLEDNLKNQREERLDTLDTFFDGLEESDGVEARRPQELLNELQELVHLPLKLPPDSLRRLPDGDDDVRLELRDQMEAALTQLQTNRLIGAVERRLEEETGLRTSQLREHTWDEIGDEVYHAVENIFQQRAERLLGEQEQIARDLDAILGHLPSGELSDRIIIDLLQATSVGSRLAFDARTHRKTQKQFQRLRYYFLAASLLQASVPEEITGRILEHLEGALEALQRARGLSEIQRLRGMEVTLKQIDARVQEEIQQEVGEEAFEAIAARPLGGLAEDDRLTVSAIFGRYIQNEINRQLLLRVISDQWVEYLTRVEALRVSIGLEAYAQRDPLVQYKSRATTMFQELLADIRAGVISRLFTYAVRTAPPVTAPAADAQPNSQQNTSSGQASSQADNRKKKKRKRH